MSKNRGVNISALPASSASRPTRLGSEEFFAASKNAEQVDIKNTPIYTSHKSSGRHTNRKVSAKTARAPSAASITVRRETLSASVPAKGISSENGSVCSRSTVAATIAEESEITRTSPSTAIMLNQLPSSEIV